MAELAGFPRGEGTRYPLTGLRQRLDRLAAIHGATRLAGDPLGLVRPYADPRDREVAGLVASGLAFGLVTTILRSTRAVLGALGARPAKNLLRASRAETLDRFRHRWIRGEDVTLLLLTIREMLRTSKSVEAFFLEGYAPEHEHVGPALDSFSRRAKRIGATLGRPGRGFACFFPEPSGGSAVKRLNLFLRWMVRPDDGIDLGVWTSIPASALIIPVDTHVAQIGRSIGLTDRRTAGFATALDMTRSLRRLDPDDPVRYDFAIAQLGISKNCLHRQDPERCPRCPLEPVCRRPG